MIPLRSQPNDRCQVGCKAVEVCSHSCGHFFNKAIRYGRVPSNEPPAFEKIRVQLVLKLACNNHSVLRFLAGLAMAAFTAW